MRDLAKNRHVPHGLAQWQVRKDHSEVIACSSPRTSRDSTAARSHSYHTGPKRSASSRPQGASYPASSCRATLFLPSPPRRCRCTNGLWFPRGRSTPTASVGKSINATRCSLFMHCGKTAAKLHAVIPANRFHRMVASILVSRSPRRFYPHLLLPIWQRRLERRCVHLSGRKALGLPPITFS